MPQLDPALLTSLTHILGWTLVHFLWQGVLIGFIFLLLNLILSNQSANARYLAGLSCLLLAAATPVLTFIVLSQSASTGASTEAALAGLVSVAERSLISIARDGINQMLPVLVVLWAAGVLLLGSRTLLSWLSINRMRVDSVSPLSAVLQQRVSHLLAAFRLRSVQVVESARVQVPTVIGWIRPVILLPASVVLHMAPRQLEMVIAHELGHIRRWDYLVNLLQVMIETALFYHPVVRWMSARIRIERENCCDDLVVRTCGEPITYAKALANLEGFRQGLPEPALAATGGNLLQRVRRLCQENATTRSGTRGTLAITMVLGLVAGLGAQSDLLTSNNQASLKLASPVITAPASDEALLANREAWRQSLSQVTPAPVRKPVAESASSFDDSLALATVPLSSTPETGRAEGETAGKQYRAEAVSLEAEAPVAELILAGGREIARRNLASLESTPASAPDPAGLPSEAPELLANTMLTGLADATRPAMAPLASLHRAVAEAPARDESVFELERMTATGDLAIRAIEKQNPRYPIDALRNNLEGYVKLEFSLNRWGRPTKVEVLDAFPEKVFDKVAKRAMRNWRFEVPESLESKPMKLVQTFDFTLEDSMVAQDVSELRQCSLTGSRLCRNHVPNVQVVWVNPSSKSRQP